MEADFAAESKLKLDRALQDQHNQDPESLQQDREQQSLHSGLEQVQVQDKDSTQDDVDAKEHKKCPPDPPQDQLEVQGLDQNPTGDNDRGRALASPQDQDRAELQGHTGSDQDQDQDQMTAAAHQEAAGESGGSVPALVITQAEESLRPAPVTPVQPAEPRRPQRPADLVIPVIPADPSLSSSSDGGDMACSDLLSLRSDSLSLTSEPAISRTSEEDDSRSVAASSVMSLFQRVQLDPLEKDWLRSSALGNMAAQRHLLSQEPSLVLKKDFITGTALHWAAKQGRQEAVDMMLRSGADVNVRSHVRDAKTSIRDYHGKTAVHYWSGCTDVFSKPDSQSGGRFHRGRQTQRYALPSLLLSRSRSQGQLNLEFGTVPQSASHDVLDLQV
ncbi:ankyrin repeat domain-containing protein SOWAHC isoform X2 [Siniperca chuatsi]|nr:ankyrin repeat domain-containing protein SOWAHC isoform X2 [Siniperca chuatsi]XP_044048178.1 ankyrin repeat domain-containing protein SOWAHC isoform X2 [Siniperca chuatsi]